MADAAELKLRITVQSELVEKMRAATEQMGSLKSSTLNLAAGLEILKTGYEAVEKVIELVGEQFHKAIEASVESEKANARLIGSLISTGQYSKEAADGITKYAADLQKADGANATTTKSLIGMGIQMGLSVSKAKEMEEASRKLAVAIGKDVNEAFSILRGTLAGHSRGLALVLPQVSQLGAAHLRTGAAMGLVNTLLDAQYKLYQGTYAAGVEKATAANKTMYEALGNIITQNPIFRKAQEEKAALFLKIADAADKVNAFLKAHQYELEGLVKAGEKTAIVLATVAAGFAVATGTAGAFAATLAFVTGPIGLTVIAAGLLTAAFYKWPGVFTVVTGAFKTMSAGLLAFVFGPMLLLIEGAGKLASIYDKELGKSLTAFSEKMAQQIIDLGKTGIAQAEAGVAAIKAGDQTKKAATDSADAIEKERLRVTALAAAKLNLIKTYAGISIGSENERKALAGEVEERAQNLTKFQKYLEDKTRLAVSQKMEEQSELAKLQAGALKGSGGSAEKKANANSEVIAEEIKQTQLQEQYHRGALNLEAYNQAKLASQQRASIALLNFELADKRAQAEAMGETEGALAAKQAIDDQIFQLKLQQMRINAKAVGNTQDQIDAEQAEAVKANDALKVDQKEQFIQKDMAQNEKLGNNWEASLDKIRLAQVRQGKLMGAIRGVQQTEEFKGVQGMLGNLASLRSGHSKKMFDIGQKAAIAQAGINTFLSATEAYSALAGIPLVGPILGALAAAAAVAAGVINIQNISSQKFNGGQGDEGMDHIPQSLSGKSFITSGGERIVQPSANKELTAFLEKQKSGGGHGGNNYNISLQYSGSGSKDDAVKMADIVLEEVRRRSERGTPVLSSKGVY